MDHKHKHIGKAKRQREVVIIPWDPPGDQKKEMLQRPQHGGDTHGQAGARVTEKLSAPLKLYVC